MDRGVAVFPLIPARSNGKSGGGRNARRKGAKEMPFPIPLAAAIFLTIWFTVLFAVLPFGVRSQQEAGEVTPGTDPAAPVTPRLLAKFTWTTLISAAIFAAVVAVANYTE
jgi:predicted secreted protein